MARAMVNGVALSYRQLGEGPDVLFVHGLAANMAFWSMPALRRLAERFRLTLCDLRGHGYSDMPLSGYTTADLAQDLEGLLDCAGVERAHLVGHSYGAAVALHLAVERPERALSLTLADAVIASVRAAPRLGEWPEWQRWAARLRDLGIDVPADQTVDQGLLELIARPEWEEARRRFGDDRLFLPFAGWNGGRRGAMQWRRLLQTTTARVEVGAIAGLTPERIAALPHPTCAIYGEHSHCWPTFEWLRRNLSRCRAIVAPGLGHFHPAVAPGPFAAHVAAFVSDVAAGAADLDAGAAVPAAQGEHT